MGMYDELEIHSKWLPKKIKKHTTGWQTKSLYCGLDEIKITKSGKLWHRSPMFFADSMIFRRCKHDGEVRFYNTIGGERWEFIAFFKRGKMYIIIQTHPQE